jgi:hypothetical protein
MVPYRIGVNSNELADPGRYQTTLAVQRLIGGNLQLFRCFWLRCAKGFQGRIIHSIEQ